MKNIIYNFYIGAILIFAFSACEDVATNVKIPPSEKKIVVQCFISPESDTIWAMVSWSIPIIGTSYFASTEFIKDASVIISDGVITETLKWKKLNNLYCISTSKFEIKAATTYYLTVQLPDGKKVTANCTTPLGKNQSLNIYKIDSAQNQWNETIINCSFKYNIDAAANKNFLRISSSLVTDYNYLDDYVTGEFKTDNDLNSENFYNTTFWVYRYTNSKKIKAWLINSDYNYFQYHKSLQNAQMNYGVFTEPSIIYSNINGGLGCFGAYYSHSIEVKLK